MEPDAYSVNLRMSTMQDASILPSEGGRNRGQGSYKNIDPSFEITQRENIRHAIGNVVSLTEAKLPKPVKVSNINIIRQQPAINLADVEYPMLNDLDNNLQEEVLGSVVDHGIRNRNIMIEKLRNIQMQNPVLIPGVGGVSKNKLLKMLQ